MDKLFPAREILVSDIPAEDGKIDNLFYSVSTTKQSCFEEDKMFLIPLK